jgi:hypothetical protein
MRYIQYVHNTVVNAAAVIEVCKQIMSAEDRIVTGKQPVLFLGEGNFSFSIAIAARRGSWEDICATVRCEVEENTAHSHLLAQINNVFKIHPTPTDVLDPIRAIVSLRDKDPTRVGNIDATDLSAFFDPQDTASDREKFIQNIYFQCPWIHPNDQLPALLIKIITSAANVQKPGNCLYFGLTSHQRYAGNYRLNDVIAKAEEKGYIRLDDDRIITATAIAYGYYHYSTSGHDLQNLLLQYHYTLCLEKKSSIPSEMLDTASDIISALSLSEKDVATPPSTTAVTRGTSSTKSAASLSACALEMSANSKPRVTPLPILGRRDKGVTPSKSPALPESSSSTNSTTNEMNAALNAELAVLSSVVPDTTVSTDDMI